MCCDSLVALREAGGQLRGRCASISQACCQRYLEWGIWSTAESTPLACPHHVPPSTQRVPTSFLSLSTLLFAHVKAMRWKDFIYHSKCGEAALISLEWLSE